MTGFWAQRLGQQGQPPAAQPAQPAPSSRPWWQPAPVQQPTHMAPPATVTQPVPQQQQASVTPDGTSHFGDLLTQDGYTTTKAQSARDTERCPDCDGPNYVAEKGAPNSMKHCFDCGYNPRFSQSMSGMSGTGQNIPVKTARVQQMNTNTFDPSVIVGHV